MNPARQLPLVLSALLLLGCMSSAQLARAQRGQAATPRPVAASTAEEQSPLIGSFPGGQREYVRFAFEHAVASGEAVFVLGDVVELGADDVRRSVPLQSTDGVHWQTTAAIPLRTVFRYRYFVRENGNRRFADPDNGTPLSEEQRGTTTGWDTERPAKRMQVHTALPDPVLRWRFLDEQVFRQVWLVDVGPGRDASERRYSAAFAVSGERVEFFVEGSNGVREPTSGQRGTKLDAFFVQGDGVYTYVPAPVVTPQRRALPMIHPIQSGVLGRKRTYRVMLPRGYDEHLERRYPVLYIYDGQQVWDANGTSGWDPNGAKMRSLIRRGEVGEIVMVAIDNDTRPCGRARDCLAPDDTFEDTLTGCTVQGASHEFLTFVLAELKPRIDATYRTRPEREHTLLCGYSFGGLLAFTAGWDFAHGFGGVGVQSGSLWAPTNFMNRVRQEPLRDVRLHFDFGDRESFLTSANLAHIRHLVRQGYAFEGDINFHVGFGSQHTFAQGGSRIGVMMRFLYPGTAETPGF